MKTAAASAREPVADAIRANDAAPMPSHDLDVEAAVISAVLLSRGDHLPKILDFLLPEHFYSEAHRRIYEAILELFYAKEPIDEVLVGAWLKERNRLLQVGGLPYISKILDCAPVVTNLRAYAMKIHDAWRRRQVTLAARRFVVQSTHGHEESANVQAWCESIAAHLGVIAMTNPVRPVESNTQVLDRILAEAFDPTPIKPGEVPIAGFPTGLYNIDRRIGGLRKGAKTTVVAATGVGKTAFAVQVMRKVAHKGGGVLFFSKEMKRAEILKRALLQEAQVSANRVKTRTLTASMRQALVDAKTRIDALPIIIVDTPRLTIEELSAVARQEKENCLRKFRVPLVLVVDDNVNRSEPSRHMVQRERNEQLEHHTKNFKILCQEEDLAGLELAQGKESAFGKKREKPRENNGVAESSKIGKEADELIYLWPDGERVATADDPRTSITAIFGKVRDGLKEDVSLMYRGDMFTFTDPNAPDAHGNPSRQYVDPRPNDADEKSEDSGNYHRVGFGLP